MKIILVSIGTRGDMEPFLAIGEMLKAKGHQVICAFPEQFRNLADDSNLEFASLGSKFINLLKSEPGKDAMGGATGFKKVIGTLKLAFSQKEASKELLFRQQEILEGAQPDRILYHPKAMYPIIWRLQNKGKTILISPIPYMHYVMGHTHLIFNSNFGTFFNKLTFSLAHFGMMANIKMSKKWLKIKERFSRKAILDNLKYNETIYTVSPSLFQRPAYWHKNLHVLGFHERNKVTHWHPDPKLTDFIERHDKIVLITFGSMINANPKEKTSMFIEILQRNNIPAIINTASGGLIEPEVYDNNLIHFVTQIPYDWIFPKVYATIHHGGSGTTHTAFKYGCPTLIIPHIIDQFGWNNIVFEKGVGPKGIKINKINVANLEPKILDLLSNADYKSNSELISAEMAKEDFEEALCNTIVE